jgi:penicillin-binding protein 2
VADASQGANLTTYERPTLNLAVRARIALALLFLCFFAIGLRLWFLQIINGEYFRDKSENNRLRSVYIPPPRGLIYDRNGNTLVKNRPSFNIELVPEDSPDPRGSVIKLAHITGKDQNELLEAIKQQRKRRPFEPKVLIRDTTRDVVAKVIARRYDLPGVIVSVAPARHYVFGDLAAHVLGYIREITRQQLENPRYANYRLGDMVGQYGIESVWERLLQGQRGVQAVIVNAMGTKIGEASFDAERAGHNLTLTLDLESQKAADEALRDKRGAIVAMNPGTGEIIAMSSSPRFDPNLFTGEVSPEAWADLVSGSEKKLNNRAVQGSYHPGSVFKIFMSTAGLSEGVITPRDTVFCHGGLTVGNHFFRCHKKTGHGSVSLFEGVVQSCDVYFYTVGQRLGIDRIHDYAVRFGLGMPTGLELVEESAGLVPSTAWKKSYYKNPEEQKWYPGETPSVAIGQGAVVLTPLQIARGISALVNGGFVLRPYLVKKVESEDGTFRDDSFTPKILGKLDVEPWITETVRQGLVGVGNDPLGTGRRAQLGPEFPGITVAGKTGTAQVVGMEHGAVGKELKDHAWFAGYAPADKPELVVVALVENGGHGGVESAPLVRQVMEAFFRDRRVKVEKVAEKAGSSSGAAGAARHAHPAPEAEVKPTAEPQGESLSAD